MSPTIEIDTSVPTSGVFRAPFDLGFSDLHQRTDPAQWLWFDVAANAVGSPVVQRDLGPRLQVVRILADTYWLGGPQFFRPVGAHIEVDEDGSVIAHNQETGIFGVGSDFAAAIVDLREALFEHLNILADSNQLSDELSDQLQFLKVHLRTS